MTGDSVYGGGYKLRRWLEERLRPYVGVAVPKDQRIGLTHRADEVVATSVGRRGQSKSAFLRVGLAVIGLPLDRAWVEAVAAGSAQSLWPR